MSTSQQTATAIKSPPQVPPSSAWSKGPPTSAQAQTPRSQSPAPSGPISLTHSRRPSTLGQGVHVKDGVSVPPRNIGSVKQGPSVTFGSINDASAPISSSPASVPPIKSEGVKSFGSVPVDSSRINGKSSTSGSTASPKPPPSAPLAASSVPPSTPSLASSAPSPATAPRINKVDVKKFFQGPGSSPPSSHTASNTSSPASRPSSLPSQQQLPPPSLPHHQQATALPSPSLPPSQITPHSPHTFVPSGLRQHQNSGPGSGPPRSPQISRQQQNGNAPRPPHGGAPPSSVHSPRLGVQHVPPQGHPQMGPWPPQNYAYYPSPGPDYLQYYGYMGAPAFSQPHQQHPPHQPLQPHLYPPPTPGQPHPSMSPARAQPLQLQSMQTQTQPPQPQPQPPSSAQPPPSTPTHQHQHPHPHPHPQHGHTLSVPDTVGGMAPASSPLSATTRLSRDASAFTPPVRKPVIMKTPEGKELNFGKADTGAASPVPGSPGPVGGFTRSNRSSIRMETEEAKKKREELAKEKEKEKEMLEKNRRDATEKAKWEAEEKERRQAEEEKKKEEERLRAEEDRARREEEEKEKERERIRKALEEEEARKAEEDRKRQQEEEQRLKEEQDRLKAEAEAEAERERLRKEAEELEQSKTETVEEFKPEAPELEEGEIEEEDLDEVQPVDDAEELARDKTDKENLRIDTTAPPPPPSGLPKKRPGPIDTLVTDASRGILSPSLPSALATARVIDNLSKVPYPDGIKSPDVELNTHAKDGKFRYDREFLMQFMKICTDKPDMLPPLDAIGLEPADQSHGIGRGGAPGRRPTGVTPPSSSRNSQIGLGINPPAGFGAKPGRGSGFDMGNFQTQQKLNSEERFANSSRTPSTSGVPPNMQRFPGSPMARTASQGGPGSISGSGRTRSLRGQKRDRDPTKAGPSGYQQQQAPGSSFGPSGPHQMHPGFGMEPIVPLTQSTNAWAPTSVRRTQPVEQEASEIVDRKVKGLLNRLTMERFDSISDQIIGWANRSEEEQDGKTLMQVIRLVFEKATDEAPWSEMYARLCRKMMEQISSKVQDVAIKNAEGKPIAGGQLVRKYLLNRCQEDFERGWIAKEATAAAAATKAIEDQAAKAAQEKAAEGGGEEEVALYSDEYYAAQKAKRRGLGLIKFIGELFKLQMLTERIMHECVKKLLGNVQNPEEEEIESLCKLLSTVGKLLDTSKARSYMDIYFTRMKELCKNPKVSARMQFMLQDVIELRERDWATRNLVAIPATIAQIHEAAAKEKAAQEKDSYQRQQTGMTRGGSRRGGDRGSEYPQADGWAVAGGSGPARLPTKPGDLSQFGKFNKTDKAGAPLSFAPGSIFGRKEAKRESAALSRTNSSSNMFSMLSSNTELTAEPVPLKSSQPPSRKPSGDFSQLATSEGPPQRRKLQLLPRSKAVEEMATTPVSENASDAEDEDDTAALDTMSEEEALKKISEDRKEFFAVRNLEEAEVYFTTITPEHRFRLVNQFVSFAIESKEPDARLVADFFRHAADKGLCSPESFEEGFALVAELLDDIAVDAPKAPNLIAMMLEGSGLDQERRDRIAAKLEDPAAFLELLS